MKISDKFFVPEDHIIVETIGSYTFSLKDGVGYLCGNKVRKYSETFVVANITINFIQKKHLQEQNHELVDIFDLEDDVWYVGVNVDNSVDGGGYSFLFESINDACYFSNCLLDTFKQVLERTNVKKED
jgi:hypothetical protein